MIAVVALGVIGPERPAEVSLYALLGGGDLSRLGATLALTRPAQQRLQQAGLGGRATVRFAGDPQRELLEELAGTTVDCLIVGWSAEVSVVDTIQALADADLADLIVVGGNWTAGEPGVSGPAASNAAVLADLSGTDAAAVAELAARMARHLRAPIHTLSAGRAGRAALEQLERAGYRTSPAGSPGGSPGGLPNGKTRTPAVEVAGAAGDGRVAVSVAGLGMGSGGLDVAVVAKVAAAVSLLLLIKGRSGERAALVERVALVGSTQVAD